jgi:type III secretory pathway component EscU
MDVPNHVEIMEFVSMINVSVTMVIMARIVKKLSVLMIVINAVCVPITEYASVENIGVLGAAENINFANQKTSSVQDLVEILLLNSMLNQLVLSPDAKMIATIMEHALVMVVSAMWGGPGTGVKSSHVRTTASLMEFVIMEHVVAVQDFLVRIVIGLKISFRLLLVPQFARIFARWTNNATHPKVNVCRRRSIFMLGVPLFMM